MNFAMIGDDTGAWVMGPPAEVVEAIEELTRERDALVAEPSGCDITDLPGRFWMVATYCTRLAVWWHALARHTGHAYPAGWEVYQRAALHARDAEHHAAQQWSTSARTAEEAVAQLAAAGAAEHTDPPTK